MHSFSLQQYQLYRWLMHFSFYTTLIVATKHSHYQDFNRSISLSLVVGLLISWILLKFHTKTNQSCNRIPGTSYSVVAKMYDTIVRPTVNVILQSCQFHRMYRQYDLSARSNLPCP